MSVATKKGLAQPAIDRATEFSSSVQERARWSVLADQVLAGHPMTREQGLAILQTEDSELLAVLDAAFLIRQRFFGKRVRVHVLQNARSGTCPEDCSFCSQSVHFDASVPQYRMQTVEELVAGAERAAAMGAVTYCMVTSTRGPSPDELETVCDAVTQIKARFDLNVCTSLGLLGEGQAERLVAAGVDRYNHNLESSERYFPEVCSTHGFVDRWRTVEYAKRAGLEACCGGILGMGETAEDWVDLALSLRDLGVESVPINLLDPRPGTPLEDVTRMTPQQCLRGLAMFRFALPEVDLRVAGGREANLGALQPLALFVANSLFTNGYLTTGGAAPSADARMISEAGFEAELAAEHG